MTLTMVLGCSAPVGADRDLGAPPQSKVPAVTVTLNIEQHFKDSELALARAAAIGDAEQVRHLVRDQRVNADAVSSGGLPLLAWPLLQGNVEGVQSLLENGANPNLAVPAAGTLMTWAAKADNPRMLQALLDSGGDVNAVNANDEPLTRVAALAGRWDNVKLLVERGAEVDARAHGQTGDTLLGYYSAGQFDKTHWLLEHGADPSRRIEHAAAATRIGAQPIVENVYWWPVQAGRFPELAQWQQRCQNLLAARGLTAPAEPAHLQRLRLAQGTGDAPARTRDLGSEIRDNEAQVKHALGER